MAIDTSNITSLINDFRALSQKDSISPESLGALLQRIADLLASCNSEAEVKPLKDLLENISSLPDTVLSISNGSDNPDNVLVDISKGNVSKGSVYSLKDQVLVRQASSERAGAMTTQHVSDLATAKATAETAKNGLSTLKEDNAKDHAAIRKEATDALAAHAAANDKAFADEASARKAVSDALTAHETADAADHAAIRKTLSNSLASAKQEQHDTLGISGIVAFDGFVGDVSDDTSETAAPIVRDPKGKVQQGAATVHFSTADGGFLIKQDGSYYPKWDDDYLWQDSKQVPWANKAYYNVNDGKLYKIGSDNQLHEIALTKLRDDTGILPCKVRTSAPLGTPATGYPTAHNYTIWWSQTTKAFFAALGYDPAANDDAIEGCEYYPLSVCDEYYDYCSVTDSGGAQTAVPRADRIFRSGNDLWQYDSAAGEMVKLGDVTGKDLAIQYLECGDATLQGDVEVTGILEVGNGATVVGNLTVSNAAYADELHADKVLRLDKEDVGAMLVHVFHGIRQSLPTDYTAATLPLTPKTRTDGVADIIYVREKKRFYAFWEAQKAYAERFDGDAEYNIITNNKPTTARTDRTWRCAGKLYAWDAEFALKDPSNLLSAYVGDLTCLNDSAKEAFIKSWNEAFYKGGRKFGEYNRETGYFEGNGLTDINYEQAKVIMKFVGLCQNPTTVIPKIDGPYTSGGLSCFWFDFYGEGKDSRAPRTFPPLIQGSSGGYFSNNGLFAGDYCLQAVSFAGGGGMTGNEEVFRFCRNLRYVLNMQINDSQGTKNWMFAACTALETVELKGLYQGTVSFEYSPKLSLDSIKFMLNNREKSGAALTDEKYKFTIKLHADVFKKLTDDIIALAAEMNATLVSA